MKYRLTEETKTIGNMTLHRIEALEDIGRHGVKKGDKGGWIEKEDNLSQTGDAWVSGDARVYGNAWVYGDAWVSGDARVYGDAQVSGDAWVSGDAQVSGNAWVSGDAQVYGDARVSGDARFIAGSITSIGTPLVKINYENIEYVIVKPDSIEDYKQE